MNATPPWSESDESSDMPVPIVTPENDDADELGIRIKGLDREQLNALADKVYALLRHELKIERERYGRRDLA